MSAAANQDLLLTKKAAEAESGSDGGAARRQAHHHWGQGSQQADTQQDEDGADVEGEVIRLQRLGSAGVVAIVGADCKGKRPGGGSVWSGVIRRTLVIAVRSRT